MKITIISKFLIKLVWEHYLKFQLFKNRKIQSISLIIEILGFLITKTALQLPNSDDWIAGAGNTQHTWTQNLTKNLNGSWFTSDMIIHSKNLQDFLCLFNYSMQPSDFTSPKRNSNLNKLRLETIRLRKHEINFIHWDAPNHIHRLRKAKNFSQLWKIKTAISNIYTYGKRFDTSKYRGI